MDIVPMKINLAWLLLPVLLILSSGCATGPQRNPVPFHLMPEANVPGMGPIRYWGDEIPRDVVAEFRRTLPYMPKLVHASRP